MYSILWEDSRTKKSELNWTVYSLEKKQKVLTFCAEDETNLSDSPQNWTPF